MNLFQAIEKVLTQPGMNASRIGREAIGDKNLVRDLRRGRELRPRTRERLVRYLRDHGVPA
jgi:tRNA-dihydrouridine synthase